MYCKQFRTLVLKEIQNPVEILNFVMFLNFGFGTKFTIYSSFTFMLVKLNDQNTSFWLAHHCTLYFGEIYIIKLFNLVNLSIFKYWWEFWIQLSCVLNLLDLRNKKGTL